MSRLETEAEPQSFAGQLLVAMPGIGDARFERAVVYMCAHNAEHAMGLALNRPVDGLTLADLLDKLGVEAGGASGEAVLIGGPLEVERGFVLHTDDYSCDGASLAIGDGVSLTASREVLDALAHPSRRPRRSVLALGYAGWGPGQLEQELLDNVWLVCNPDESLIFDEDHADKWGKALAKLGVSAERLSSVAGRA